MVYNTDLESPMQLFQEHTDWPQTSYMFSSVTITQLHLLMPAGWVTLFGLKYNIAVGIVYWFLPYRWRPFLLPRKGWGFSISGLAMDKAPSVVGRWQLESNKGYGAVFCPKCETRSFTTLRSTEKKASGKLMELVQKREFPEIIATYLNLEHVFVYSQFKGCLGK